MIIFPHQSSIESSEDDIRAIVGQSGANTGQLAAVLGDNKQKLIDCMEEVCQLGKLLTATEEPLLLNDILKHKVNRLVNAFSSAVIYNNKGLAPIEYLFYYDNERDSDANQYADSASAIGADSFGYLYEHLRRSEKSAGFFELDLTIYADIERLHPFFAACQKQGFQKATIVNLFRGAEFVGFWVLVLNHDADINDLPNCILEQIIIQLASAVYCINTSSQLSEAKKENDVLQSLNVELASARDEDDLFKIIRSKLLNLFQFSHHFIYKINDDQMTASVLLIDAHSRSQNHPLFETTMKTEVNIADGIFNKALLSTEPVILDLEKLNERKQLPLYLRINYESGVKKVLMLALRVDFRVMGIWCIAFTGEQPVRPRYIELAKTIAAPISVAVDNIRISESLRYRETERNKLMDLSFELTSVKSKAEFIGIIEPYLRKFFIFNSMSVFVHADGYEDTPFIYLAGLGLGNRVDCVSPEVDDWFKGGQIFSRLCETADPNVASLERIIERTGGSPFLKSEYDGGTRGVVSIALRNDNRQIGTLSLYLMEGIHLHEPQLHLLKEVSYQIAKTVSNILHNEEIASREREKELLLAVSEDIAATREKDQLIRIINERIRPVLKFEHISLSMKCPDGFIVSFLNDPNSKSRGHQEYAKVQRLDISRYTEFIDFIDSSSLPVSITRTSRFEFQDLPKFLTVNFESGIEEILIARLYDGVTVFGYWVLCFASRNTIKTSQFGLLQAIANQLSTAVYNIRANMEIAERQKENELLITFSNDSAGLRNYCELIRLMSTKLKNAFNFDNFFVGVTDEDGQSISILLPNENPGKHLQLHEPLKIVMTAEIKRLLDNADSPCIIDGTSEFDAFPTVHRGIGPHKTVITNFVQDNKILAFWVVSFPEEKNIEPGLFRMLKGISDQLSIAVANIQANNKLAYNEKRKGLLLSLSTKVSSARNPVDLLKVLASELKRELNFSHGSIVLFDNREKTFALPWVLPAESKSSGHARYKDIIGLTPVYDGVADLALRSDKPLIIDIVAFSKNNKMPLYMQVSFESGMSHVMFTKLIINGEVLGFWVLWYGSAPDGTPAYLESVEEIANVLTVPIFNISFNEQINKREHEKSTMLEFAGAIADVKDRFELRKIFNHYLKNLCLIEDICLHWFSEDKSSHFCYFWKDKSEHAAKPDFEKLISALYPANDIILGNLISGGVAARFQVAEIMAHPEAPSYAKLFYSEGISDIIGVPLYKGKEMVGVLFVKEYDANYADQPLFKGLCSQLAIAVSDLIATDKITKQLAEINSYKERLEEEKVYLRQELETSHNYSEIIGESDEIKQVFRQVSQVAASDSTVLIQGETGTGKELVARAIHNHSSRENKLMIKVNCAALPASLIESELFGHERGSFTGATEKRIGKFELANGGTLFLDEIGELPLELQVKFLRALQEREIERIGGKATIKIDVRIITATNRNLETEVAEGRFRSDLYFRLSTFPIYLPSLRERKADLALLAGHFAARFAKKTGKPINMISQKAMQELMAYNWPGNVRELEHQIERSVLLATSNTIKSFSLPTAKQEVLPVNLIENSAAQTIDDHERDLILKTLKQCFGKISGPKGAAELLGVPSSTLNSKMKRLGIKKSFRR
ncbi:sigma 54-interacting transcriptional regulator [Mucilaginibacter rubeus]|uniref:sigma 54-interacting transcriptional regulator n=1 Tax=Mucilaginibacter rubeus TaxID=2027860 RepID=UPI001667F7C0|nr:sigma 54-interacting transcriptional regulator [Mucilaginibacter rubeus]GGA96101.1 hypothetical protein GCM10011500_09850 [Mucilaginibacter rubeus]